MKRFILILLTIIGVNYLAIGQITTGSIEGRVVDNEGKPLSDAQIVAKNLETGLVRGTITAKSGTYRILGLQPGKYEITAMYVGYRKTTKIIEILMGQVETINFTLVPEAIELGAVEVVAVSSPIELKRTDVSMPVRREQIVNLPLDTRNIMNLAALVPGIKYYSPIGGRALPEAGSLPPLRFIQLYVDGVEWKSYFNGNIVGIPQTGSPLPQEAVREFRVVLNAFDPEYTRGTAYVISAVTQRGTNEFRGMVFANYRHKNLNARGPFQSVKPNYNRQQVGLSISGPIVPDKLFFFGSYELNNEKNYIDVVPGRPAYAPGIWDQYRGTFDSPTANHTGVVRLTYQPTTAHTFDLIWATRYMDSKFFFGGTFAYTAGIYGRYHINSFLFRDTWIISSNAMNELSLHYLRWRHDEPLIKTGPAYIYPSISLGRGTFPIRLAEDHYRLVNKFTYNLTDFYGEHVFKAGFEITRTTSSPWFPYFYYGQFVFDTDTSTLPRTATIGIGFTDPYTTKDAEGSLDGWTIGAFIQDRWTPIPQLTLSFGVRWDADINTMNNKFKVRWADSTELTSKIPEEYFNRGNRENDLDNFAPRISFTWDVFGTGKTILRGGYGIFFDRLPNFIAYFEQLYSKWGIYTFINPGTTDPNVLRQRILGGQGTIRPTVYLLHRRMLTPAVYQFSLGIGHQLTSNLGITIDYINNRATALYVQTNANYYIPSQRKRAISDKYSDIYLWGSYGRAFYHGFLTNLLYKTASISVQLSYTLSWAYSDFDGVTPPAYPFASSYRKQRSSADERHRFVLNWIINLPFGVQFSGIGIFASPRPYNVIVGMDLNDNNFFDDDWPNDTRIKTLDWRKIRNWYKQVDIRLSKSVTLRNTRFEIMFDAFNVFNWFNAAGYFNRMYDARGNPLANFGLPNSSYAPRYLQVGIRFFYE
ncbi:MAG: carboxypeptidase regulatory-like domain-containing protein [Candidatus Kryptonium sp.]|nr:carboxypeptidase regulatory-like domain-containing protein [Candidatus Kryptonium sp.]MCX7762753.1 carboxypeptidase regulatory-like domain-containing protein [Candidatus Kryptonium sp.]MDW8108641.1 carboxypeptidase regulatory-like domain-containing protein [Candidatus Kryptonium sp.]